MNKILSVISIVFLGAKIVTFLFYPVAILLDETLLTQYKVKMIGTVIAVIGLAKASLSVIAGTIVVIYHYAMIMVMTLILLSLLF